MKIEGACHPMISVCPFNVFSRLRTSSKQKYLRRLGLNQFDEMHKILFLQKNVAW